MMNRPKKLALSGVEKTAILMNSLGEEKSYALMKHMKDIDVRRLLNVMGQMKKAPIALINAVLREYLFRLSEQEDIIFEDSLSKPEIVTKQLGEERAKIIFGNLKNANLVNRRSLTVLNEIDPKMLAEFLSEEHPQTVALVVAHMEVDKQMKMIKSFPDNLRTEVILRMANLEYVSPDRIDELDEVLKKELSHRGAHSKSRLGGVAPIADLINSLDKKTMNSIMSRLEDKDALLAEEIRQNMFTFTDITKIDDRGVQLILREVNSDKLLLSLKSVPEEVSLKIFGAMSDRAAQLLKEDLEALGPQKVSDIESAQREIVKVVRRLEEEGKIIIGVGEENEVVE